MHLFETRVRLSATLALACAAAIAVAGCGSSDDSGSSASASSSGSSGGGADITAATRVADAAAAVPAFTLDAPPVDMARVRGKTLFNIPLSSENPYVTSVDAEIKAQAEAHGVRYVEFANQGQPAQWGAGIEQAIARRADVILLSQGPDPKVLVPQLQKAKAAGIPVVLSHLYGAGEAPPDNVRDLIGAYTTVDFDRAASLMVDAAFAQTRGDVNPLVITSNEVAPSKGMAAAIQARVKELCGSCEATLADVPLTQWASKLGSTTQTALQKDPKINWVLPLYDSMSTGVISGINSAGKGSKVNVASFNGTPDILRLIQSGGPMKADVGESTNWLGRAALDQSFRLLAGQEPVPDGEERTPLRIFTPDNVDEAGTPPVATKGYGDAYVPGYDKLWGGGS
jgi:ribose transport system substrate-binding protein